MSMTSRRTIAVLWAVCAGLALGPGAWAGVRVWEEPLTLPAYGVGAADTNPRFYDGRGYQGAKGPVYPYPMLDVLTHEKSEQTYTALYLENEYVRFMVLPEIGGRIFEAYDKTKDHHFFYRQHVIKPDLIGMLGAWISGGVEWCVFHHHRNTTFMPVDYTLEEHKDGSKTIWIGETERRHRMKWTLGLTLHPGVSRLDVTARLFNDTPYAHSFLYWANVAIHATEGYQVIFPPSTQFATFHGKNEFARWPISHEEFNGMDYTEGVDVSWWKNHPKPTSFFAWNVQEDFFAGYDHGLRAGVVHVADHHIAPGMKLWTWGTESTWDRTRLTDEDGPYAEIMVGAWSDNQPDYSWLQPHETKDFMQSWYPLRDLGGVCNATLEAAVNLEIGENRARVAFNTAGTHEKARAVLTAGGQTLLDETIAIAPDNPFSSEAALLPGAEDTEVRAALYAEDGTLLVDYQPRVYAPRPMPEPVTPPPAPGEIETVEELYLAGQRLEQFHNPTMEPYPYYEEALKRDPDNVRVNTVLAIDDCKRGRYGQAEKRLRRAVARLTHNHTRPRNGEPHYYLGVALAGQQRYDEACDAYNRAAWNAAWYGPAQFALAQLASREGDFGRALEHIDNALSANTRDVRAMTLRAAVLRQLGRAEAALKQARVALDFDPLDFTAANERALAQTALGKRRMAKKTLEELARTMRGQAQSYLNLATDYSSAGLHAEASEVLARHAKATPETDPMVYYHLGYCAARQGAARQAAEYYARAAAMPTAYCFPFRLESIQVLRHAMESRPDDARAPYYLGNLLYDRQPDAAVAAWEKSVETGADFPTVHRNLGYAYAKRDDDYPKAIAAYERAIACDDSDPRVFYELEKLYEVNGTDPETRLAVLSRNQETTGKRSDLVARQVRLFVQTGQHDTAIDMLAGRRFDTWEGGTGIHDTWVEAHTLRGKQALAAGNAQAALADFQAALEYPANLGVDRPLHDPPAARTHLLVAAAHEALGNEPQAREALEQAAATDVGGSEYRYDKGVALAQLDKPGEAKKLFDALETSGRNQLEKGGEVDFFMKFGEKQAHSQKMARAHYLLGLGALGNGDAARAREHFTKALEENPNHLWARIRLEELP